MKIDAYTQVEDEKHDAVNEFEDLKLSSKGPRKVMRTGGKKPKKSKETSSEGGGQFVWMIEYKSMSGMSM